MRRILHVVNIYFTLPYFIGEQFLYFKDKGYDLYVICSPSEYLNNYSSRMKFNYTEIEIVRAIKIIKDIKAVFSICLYIKKNKINIVVGHTPKGGLLSMISAFIMRVPKRIYFRHGLVYETSTGLKRKLLILLDKIAAYCATSVVCVSPSVYQRSLDDKLNPEKKQLILGRGTCTGINCKKLFNLDRVDRERIAELKNNLGLTDNTYVIGYCGRLVRDKGIIELIQAFELLKSNNPQINLCLLLVGMFEERDALPSAIIECINTDMHIICTGYINDSIEYYYSLMNIYVLPSFREGFPTSVLEASSMQIPVLTTRVTGCIDSIIEDVTGKFVENNGLSIANGIEFYMTNPLIAMEHGRNGREFVLKHFEQELVWKEIEKLYEN